MALVNRKVGDEVEFELHGSKRRNRVEKIEAWKIEATGTSQSPKHPPRRRREGPDQKKHSTFNNNIQRPRLSSSRIH